MCSHWPHQYDCMHIFTNDQQSWCRWAKRARERQLLNHREYGNLVRGQRKLTVAIVHPGMDDHFDPPCLNIHCEGIIGPRDFKLAEVIKKSYGFPFVRPVSMETLLNFELKFVTSPREESFVNASYRKLGCLCIFCEASKTRIFLLA